MRTSKEVAEAWRRWQRHKTDYDTMVQVYIKRVDDWNRTMFRLKTVKEKAEAEFMELRDAPKK